MTTGQTRRLALTAWLALAPLCAAAQCPQALAATDRLQAVVAAEASARDALVTIRRNAQDWKNLLLRGRDAAERQTMQARFDTQARGYEVRLSQLRAQLTPLDLELARVQTLEEERVKLFARYRAALERHGVDSLEAAAAADRAVQGADVATFRTLEKLIEAVAAQTGVAFQGLRTAIATCGPTTQTARKE
jgi:dTDP-4-amino-4,6-dideoxygalactose transaminase